MPHGPNVSPLKASDADRPGGMAQSILGKLERSHTYFRDGTLAEMFV